MKKTITHIAASVLGLVCMLNVSAQNGADILLDHGPCDPIIPVLCPSGVSNPGNATDDNLSTAATMRTAIGVLSGSYLSVGFSNPAPQGSVVAFFVESEALLNVDVLASISMRLYNASNNLIAEKLLFSLAEIEIDAEGRGLLKLRVPKNQTATSARIDVGSLLTLLNEVDIYGAVHAPSVQSVDADYVYDGGPCHPVTMECNSGVLNADQAVDDDKNNYAGLVIPLGISDVAFLDLGFSDPGPAGSTVTFTLGTNGTILGAALLQNLRIAIFDSDGNMIRSKRGFLLAEVELIGTYQFRLKLKAPSTPGTDVARARVSMNSLVGVLSEVLIYGVSYTPKINFADYFKSGATVNTNTLSIYPNPASDHLTITPATSGENNFISVYSGDGKLIMSNSYEPGVVQIDISHLSAGIYVITSGSAGKLESNKFIVNR